MPSISESQPIEPLDRHSSIDEGSKVSLDLVGV